MVTYTCPTCSKTFNQKGHLQQHTLRKNPCKKDQTLEKLVEKKVSEVLASKNVIIDQPIGEKTREQLIAICKERSIKGYSGKKKEQIIELLSPNKQKTYKVISLFSGMGGMEIGFAEQVVVHKNSVQADYIENAYQAVSGFVNLKRLPFTTVLQNDILPEAKRISELNAWNHNFILKDLRDLLKENYVFPKADVITGGFPCQDFSHAGKRQGFDSTRGTLYQSYVEVVKQVKPLIFVAENVNGLLTMPGEPIKQIISDFSAVGYEVKHQLIKCETYGIPQTRWRVIIMGLRLDKAKQIKDANWNIISENKLS